MQTTSNLTKPAPVAGNPILLESAPATTAAGGATPAPAAPVAAAPAAAPAPAPAAAAATPKPVTPEPVAKAAAPQPAPVSTTAKPIAPEAIPVSATEEAPSKNYPNINVVPQQPEGTLLPPEERTKIIEELEALRAKQGGSAPQPAGSANALAAEGQNHGEEALKQIEKCSQEGAADLYPECAPAD